MSFWLQVRSLTSVKSAGKPSVSPLTWSPTAASTRASNRLPVTCVVGPSNAKLTCAVTRRHSILRWGRCQSHSNICSSTELGQLKNRSSMYPCTYLIPDTISELSKTNGRDYWRSPIEILKQNLHRKVHRYTIGCTPYIKIAPKNQNSNKIIVRDYQ